MRPWLHTLSQLLLAVFGLLSIVIGAIDPTQRPLLLVGAPLLVIAALWRALSRNSAEPDIVDGPVPLGDGSVVDGQRITQPRSKKVAAGVGGLLLGATAAAMASGGGLARVVVLGASGALFLVVGSLNIWQARRANWMGLSTVGVTVHGAGGHFTLRWDHIDDVGVWTLRGNRFFSVWGDLAEAVGHVSGWVRRTAPKGGGSMPALVLPASLFDLPLDEVLDAAERWQQASEAPAWPPAGEQTA